LGGQCRQVAQEEDEQAQTQKTQEEDKIPEEE
jgi:hypothetical protein